MFHVINDGIVILRSCGVFYQRKAYRLQGSVRIYANHAGGFIHLGGGDGTSMPNVSWESIDLPFTPVKGELGAPTIPQHYLDQLNKEQ